jgi:translation elongation factor EF-1beta
VKPWETETDLDALFLKIKAIEMDGLIWKEEYKKEPIAYGINKLVVGCVIEDAKVSTEDLQEKIEAFEEDVQSVDIAIFSKI